MVAGAATGAPCSMRIGSSGAGELAQDSASGLTGILVAPVAEDHDAELPARHHSDVGRCIVETAVFFDDGRVVAGDDFPSPATPPAPSAGTIA